jgi:hypothetical protein
MASTYSSLKIQLMGTGENSGTWGTITNINLGTALEEAIVGSADVTFSSADVTLTLTDTNSSQTARNLRLNLTGTSGGAQNLIVPAIEKVYIVNNGCADAITIKNSGGTGIAVPAGKTMWVYNNGTNVVDAVTHLSSLTLAAALPIASGGTGTNVTTFCNLQSNVSGVLPVVNGGTGVNTSTGTGSVVLSASPTFTGAPLAPTASVTTDNTQIATTAFVRDIIPAGLISLWSGSVASIPSGWLLCDGSNGTPNLRDRFVVGAGSTYAVDATGGSANAIVVSHTHTATTDSAGTHVHNLNKNSGASDQFFGASNYLAASAAGTNFNLAAGSTNQQNTVSIASGGAHTHTLTTASAGASGTNANLPPYYALAYIMKA